MKRLTSRRRRNYLSAVLPTVFTFSCLAQTAYGQSQPKLESSGSVAESTEVEELSTPLQDMPVLEAPDRGDKLDSDIEIFGSQGESVVIEPMSPEDLQSAPGLAAPGEVEPDEIIVGEPEYTLPEVEQAMPTLRGYRPAAPLTGRQNLPHPQLGVAGELVPGWGFRVTHVLPGSAAARMQLERGDVILNINGRCVSSIRSIEQQLLRSAGEFEGQGIIKIDNVRGRTRCGAASKRFLWLKFQL